MQVLIDKREELGLSQEHIAHYVGISLSQYDEIEKGQSSVTEELNFGELSRLSEVTGLSLPCLTGKPDSKSASPNEVRSRLIHALTDPKGQLNIREYWSDQIIDGVRYGTYDLSVVPLLFIFDILGSQDKLASLLEA